MCPNALRREPKKKNCVDDDARVAASHKSEAARALPETSDFRYEYAAATDAPAVRGHWKRAIKSFDKRLGRTAHCNYASFVYI